MIHRDRERERQKEKVTHLCKYMYIASAYMYCIYRER